MAEKVPRKWRCGRRSESKENLNEVVDPNVPRGLFDRTTVGGINFAYEESPEDDLPSSRLPHVIDSLHPEEAREISPEEADARADFMAVTRPPMYQRSMSDGFYCERVSPSKATYVLMSPLSSRNRQAASSSVIDETSRDIEWDEVVMRAWPGNVDEIPLRQFMRNLLEIGSIPVQRPSLQSQASGSRDGADPSNSVRSSTLSNATTVSDEQRKQRVTITPHLDEYFRNRARNFVVDNPPPVERANLVDNEDQGDDQNPQENPQENPLENPQENPEEQVDAATQDDGTMGNYHRITNKIINSPFMFFIYIPLTFWSFYCIFEGLKYTKLCPSTDTLPVIFLFLGLTGSFACITRMFYLIVHKFTAYPLIANIVRCLQSVMFLGYFFIYLLELTSFLILDLQRLPEVCAIEYYNFLHWNTWTQMPILAIMILLHAPSAYYSKWYCAMIESS